MASNDNQAPEGPDGMPEQSEGVDYVALNKLQIFVREHLTSGVHGNFYVRGTHSGSDTRHGSLQVVVRLNQLLEDNLAMFQRQGQASSEEAGAEGTRRGRNRTLRDRLQISEIQTQEAEAERDAFVERLQTRDREAADRRQENKVLSAEIARLKGERIEQQRANEVLERKLHQKTVETGENARLRGRVSQLEQEKTALQGRTQHADFTAGSRTITGLRVSEHGARDQNADSEEPNQHIELSGADEERYDEHIEMICQYVIELDRCLVRGDVVALRKPSTRDVSQQSATYGRLDAYGGRMQARRLFNIMQYGDEVCIVKRKHRTVVDLKFGHPIPPSWRAYDEGKGKGKVTEMRWEITDIVREIVHETGKFEEPEESARALAKSALSN